MNIKPILFNTEMVKAILAGKKTVTRRVIKPQPRQGEEKPHRLPSGCWFFEIPSRRFPCTPDVSVGPYWPPCQPGDILYVRETWAHPSAAEIANGADPEMYLYKADPLHRAAWDKWRPSIHMPKEAARIFLRVTDVRVERLQDITEEGKLAEGAPRGYGQYNFYELWDRTIKPADLADYGWDANPLGMGDRV